MYSCLKEYNFSNTLVTLYKCVNTYKFGVKISKEDSFKSGNK